MSILASWLASPPLEAALEISPAAVSVAVLGGRSSNPVVQGYAVEPFHVEDEDSVADTGRDLVDADPLSEAHLKHLHPRER